LFICAKHLLIVAMVGETLGAMIFSPDISFRPMPLWSLCASWTAYQMLRENYGRGAT
jgi:hypothetical protein